LPRPLTLIISAARGGHTNVYWDIALRGFGLLLAALALVRLAAVYAPNPFRPGEPKDLDQAVSRTPSRSRWKGDRRTNLINRTLIRSLTFLWPAAKACRWQALGEILMYCK